MKHQSLSAILMFEWFDLLLMLHKSYIWVVFLLFFIRTFLFTDILYDYDLKQNII
jgi:hypothetical protein